MNHRFHVFCAASIAATLTPRVWPQTPLEWKLIPGEVFGVQENRKVQLTTKVSGQTLANVLEMAESSRWRVLAATPDGGVELEKRFETLRIENPRQTGPGAATAAKQLEGAVLRVSLNSRREVIALEGYDDLLKRLAKVDAYAVQSVRQLLPEDAMRENMAELFGSMPGRAVAIGGTWRRERRMPLGPLGALRLETNYRLEGPDKELLRINLESRLQLEAAVEPGTNAPFAVRSSDLTVDEARGTLWFDPRSGKPLRGERSLRFTLKLTAENGGQTLPMELKQESTTSFRLTDRRP